MATLALVLNAAFLVGAFVAGLAVRRVSRRWCIAAAGAALGACAAKALLLHRPDIEARLFPWPDYVMFSAWNAPVGMFAVGALAGLVRRRRDWLFLVVGGTVILAYFGDYLNWTTGSGGASINPRFTGNRSIETTSYTCGPAAAATMLLEAGIPTDEREMALLCLTRQGRGTLDLGLYRGLNLKLRQAKTALSVRLVRLSYEELLRAPKPCIVRVKFGFDHTVVVEGTEGESLLVFDPAAPFHRRPWNRTMLEKYAGWSGYAFVFYRQDGAPLPAGQQVRLRYVPPERLARRSSPPAYRKWSPVPPF